MNTVTLKQRVIQAEAERDYYASLVEAFFSGDIPHGASIDHMILAKYGRKRHEDLNNTPALLRSESN